MACGFYLFGSRICVGNVSVSGIVVKKSASSNVCSIQFIHFNSGSFNVSKTAKYFKV